MRTATHRTGGTLAGAGVAALARGVALASLVAGAASRAADSDSIPAGVRQLLQRGAIAAIFEPQFVPAGAAAIPDSAWVLGVVVDGEARAYSLNLLNSHEVVNDRVGGHPIAAVW